MNQIQLFNNILLLLKEIASMIDPRIFTGSIVAVISLLLGLSKESLQKKSKDKKEVELLKKQLLEEFSKNLDLCRVNEDTLQQDYKALNESKFILLPLFQFQDDIVKHVLYNKKDMVLEDETAQLKLRTFYNYITRINQVIEWRETYRSNPMSEIENKKSYNDLYFSESQKLYTALLDHFNMDKKMYAEWQKNERKMAQERQSIRL